MPITRLSSVTIWHAAVKSRVNFRIASYTWQRLLNLSMRNWTQLSSRQWINTTSATLWLCRTLPWSSIASQEPQYQLIIRTMTYSTRSNRKQIRTFSKEIKSVKQVKAKQKTLQPWGKTIEVDIATSKQTIQSSLPWPKELQESSLCRGSHRTRRHRIRGVIQVRRRTLLICTLSFLGLRIQDPSSLSISNHSSWEQSLTINQVRSRGGWVHSLAQISNPMPQ